MASLQKGGFFSVKSLRALWNQLHNKPEKGSFATVGEVLAWRVIIANEEERAMERQWKVKSQHAEYARYIQTVYPEQAESVLSDFEQVVRSNDQWFAVLSGRRMADLRAIALFMERCGLE